jgi:hypothetical protein
MRNVYHFPLVAAAPRRIPKLTVQGGDGDNPLEIELSDDPNEFDRLDVSNVPVLVTLTKVRAAVSFTVIFIVFVLLKQRVQSALFYIHLVPSVCAHWVFLELQFP